MCGEELIKQNYILFGAGGKCKEAIDLVGKDNILFIIDNSLQKAGTEIDGIKVYHTSDKINEIGECLVLISVGAEWVQEISNQLIAFDINNYISLQELRISITKNRLLKRTNYIEIYNRAISWIKKNTIKNEGIICNSSLKHSYPEVSGYYIPTLIRWGYRNLAIQYALWLISIQKDDGSWYDTEDVSPYIFDSAQILKGLLAIRDILPQVDESIIKGCDWILTRMDKNGCLVTPDKSQWGSGRTCTELIHLYCLSPLKEAGIVFGRNDYIEKANDILNYYVSNYKDEIVGFKCLSHFYAYIVEGLLDMGETNLAIEAMNNLESIMDKDGMVPAYKDVHWVCSTGLFQLSLIWFRIGEVERGNMAFRYACKLQNESGGWFGSYATEASKEEVNDYFPAEEISWANKYFLDALFYKNVAEFNRWADTFNAEIDRADERYILVQTIVNNRKGRVLDVGCGKGRYLKALLEDVPAAELYGVDISEKVLNYIGDDRINTSVGSICNIPYPNDSFDVVYCCEALEHAIDIESAINEIIRITKPNGEIVIIDKDAQCLGEMDIEEWEQWISDEMMTRIFRGKGLSIDSKKISFEPHIFKIWKAKK